MELAAVYSREISDHTITLSASGWTYNRTFVLYDYETESLWYHLEGDTTLTCNSGILADRRLKELPPALTRWRN
ncbi:MAG: DUF3179 domain-containing (seleno)protein [bacterium]